MDIQDLRYVERQLCSGMAEEIIACNLAEKYNGSIFTMFAYVKEVKRVHFI